MEEKERDKNDNEKEDRYNFKYSGDQEFFILLLTSFFIVGLLFLTKGQYIESFFLNKKGYELTLIQLIGLVFMIPLPFTVYFIYKIIKNIKNKEEKQVCCFLPLCIVILWGSFFILLRNSGYWSHIIPRFDHLPDFVKIIASYFFSVLIITMIFLLVRDLYNLIRKEYFEQTENIDNKATFVLSLSALIISVFNLIFS